MKKLFLSNTLNPRIHSYLYNMKKYRSINSLQKDIRKYGTKDTIFFKGIEFTMSSYDLEGKEIVYENKAINANIYITTSNRYGQNKFRDAIVEAFNFD